MLGIFFGTHFNEDEKSISINGKLTLILARSLRTVFSRSSRVYLRLPYTFRGVLRPSDVVRPV